MRAQGRQRVFLLVVVVFGAALLVYRFVFFVRDCMTTACGWLADWLTGWLVH
jgi:hypothetical protein